MTHVRKVCHHLLQHSPRYTQVDRGCITCLKLVDFKEFRGANSASLIFKQSPVFFPAKISSRGQAKLSLGPGTERCKSFGMQFLFLNLAILHTTLSFI